MGARLRYTIVMMKEMARAEVAGEFVIDKRESGCALASLHSSDSNTYYSRLLSQISATHSPPSLGRTNTSRSARLCITVRRERP